MQELDIQGECAVLLNCQRPYSISSEVMKNTPDFNPDDFDHFDPHLIEQFEKKGIHCFYGNTMSDDAIEAYKSKGGKLDTIILAISNYSQLQEFLKLDAVLKSILDELGEDIFYRVLYPAIRYTTVVTFPKKYRPYATVKVDDATGLEFLAINCIAYLNDLIEKLKREKDIRN